MNSSLTDQIVKSGIWVYGKMIIINFFNLIVISILARNLSPVEFGIVALANVVLKLIRVFIAQGSNQFIIQDNETGKEERVFAAFWIDFAFSCFCVVIGFLALPFIIEFYEEPLLHDILVCLLLLIPINTLVKVPDALLMKSLNFRKLEIRDIGLQVFSGILSVLFALSGWGVWSLIIPSLVITPIKLIVTYQLTNWRPKFKFYFNLWPKVLHYSGNVIGTSLTTFIITEGDNLLIGKVLGLEALGIYSIAWQASNIVTRTIVKLMNRLSLPALAKVASEKARMKRALNKILRLLSIVSFPLLVGLFIVADDFIKVVYGESWSSAVLPLRILIIYAIRYCVGSPTGAVFKVLGKPQIGFKIGLITVPFYFLGIFLGSKFGIVGVAVGVTVVRTISGIISLNIVSNLLEEKFLHFISVFGLPFVATAAMSIPLVCLKYLFDSFSLLTPFYSLLTIILSGGIFYLLLLRNSFNSLAEDLVNVIKPLLGGKISYVKKILKVS